MKQSTKYSSEQNKEYWDKTNESYNRGWETFSKQKMAQKEANFIERNLRQTAAKTILDIGVGTGRIISNLLKVSSVTNAYGIDISKEMIKETERRLKSLGKSVELEQVDISLQELPFKTSFDFITIIRVLKYIPNWQETVVKVSNSLNKEGIIVFTVNNAESINILAPTDNPFYRVSPAEIKQFAKENAFEIVAMESFTRIPDKVYDFMNTRWYASMIQMAEGFLSFILGKYFLGRILFVAVKKQ